jgi:hypothetical protein
MGHFPTLRPASASVIIDLGVGLARTKTVERFCIFSRSHQRDSFDNAVRMADSAFGNSDCVVQTADGSWRERTLTSLPHFTSVSCRAKRRNADDTTVAERASGRCRECPPGSGRASGTSGRG